MPDKLSDAELLAYLLGLTRNCSYDFYNVEKDNSCPLQHLTEMTKKSHFLLGGGMNWSLHFRK